MFLDTYWSPCLCRCLAKMHFPFNAASGSDQGHRRARRSASANDTGAPVSSSVTDQGGDANSTDPLLTPYNLRIVTLSCLSWDGGEQDWDASVCKVSIQFMYFQYRNSNWDMLLLIYACMCRKSVLIFLNIKYS